MTHSNPTRETIDTRSHNAKTIQSALVNTFQNSCFFHSIFVQTIAHTSLV